MKRISIWVLVWAAGVLVWENGVYAQEKEVASNNVAPKGLDKEGYNDWAENRWAKIKKELTDSKRSKDPFGAKMDPGTFDETVVVEEVTADAPVAVAKKVVSLQDAVDKFQVNGVSPKQQMVLVGFRRLHRGDMVEIEHDGELFKLRIEKITKDEVVFMNTKNEETASVRLGVVRAPGGIKGSSGKGNSGNSLKQSIFQKKTPVRIK